MSALRHVSGPCVLLAANLFLFAPFAVYHGNHAEFDSSLIQILGYSLVGFLIFSLVLFAICMAGGERYRARCVSTLLALGVLTWLQANLLVWQYGPLDGSAVDWGVGAWRGVLDSALWVGVLLLALIVPRAVSKAAPFVSVLLVVLQLLLVGLNSVRAPQVWTPETARATTPPEALFAFSAHRNVLVILLDAFQSDVFESIVSEDPEKYGTGLDGFTFFSDAVGSFPLTQLSVAALLTGRVYDNQTPAWDFVSQALESKTIVNALAEDGFDVHLMPHRTLYCGGNFSECYVVPLPYGGTATEIALETALLVMDMGLFRASPHFVKRWVYNDHIWLLKRLAGGSENRDVLQISHLEFLRDMARQAKVGGNAPTFKLIHVETTHVPMVLDETCQYAGSLRFDTTTVTTTSRCTLDVTLELYQRLRDLGVYDDSLIVLLADHGAAVPVRLIGDARIGRLDNHSPEILAGRARPLLAIKPPGSKGPLRRSFAPVRLIDLPATISSILDVPIETDGISAYDIPVDQPRERSFFHYNWTCRECAPHGFLNPLVELVIDGPSIESESWRPGRVLTAPGHAVGETTIEFSGQRVAGALGFGWSKPSDQGAWAVGPRASVFLRVPKEDVQTLSANLTVLEENCPQQIDVLVDSREVGRWSIKNCVAGTITVELPIPPDPARRDVSVVTFVFSRLDSETNRTVLFHSVSVVSE